MSTGVPYPGGYVKGNESGSIPPQQTQMPPSTSGVQQQQQQQRLLYQQRLKQQQQQQLHFEQQIYQLLTTLNRKPKRIYQFKEDSDELLKKYEQFKPSFEFHIYENNFKICAPANSRLQQHQKTPQNSNDGLILNKNNEVLREFLEYVARGIIPEAIMEVLRDCNIQFYEGCLILQVYDHTNTVDVKQESPKNQSKQPVQRELQKPELNSLNSTPDKNDKEKENSGKSFTTLKRPRMYRTLLRPNDLTHYYDMLSYADHTRFPDSMYQQLESEILTLTKRNLNLETPINPYSSQACVYEEEFLEPQLDAENGVWKFSHRDLCVDQHTKGAVDHIELHEELPQHSSTYEQLMLIMSEKTTTTTAATLAASLLKKAEANAARKAATNGKVSDSSASVGSNSVAAAAAAAAAAVGSGSNTDAQQFGRLKIIEHWRIEKERRKQQSANSNIVPSAYNTRISMGNPMTPQRAPQHTSDNQTAAQTGNANNKRTGAENDEKPKAKRGRKATKKATDGTAAQPKKRANAKKKT